MADVSLIVGTTLADWSDEIFDNVTDRNAMLAHYKQMDKVTGGTGRKGYVVVDGGYEFRETIFTNVNTTFRGYTDRETIDTAVGNPIKEAVYQQKIIAGSMNISKLEAAQNTTKAQIHDLAQTKKEEAIYSMDEIVGASMLSDGTTDTTLPGGLQQSITPVTNNVYGSIDSNVNTFWRPQRDASGVTAWNTSNEGLIALDALIQNCKRPGQDIDLIVTTNAIVSLINIMNISNLTINLNAGANRADLGFGETYYRKARVIADDNVPTGTLYAVNTRMLRFHVLKGADFEMTKMKEPIDGLYSVMQLYVFCNLTCSGRRLLGIMNNING